MLFLWNLYLFLPFSFLVTFHVLALPRKNVKESQKQEVDKAVIHTSQLVKRNLLQLFMQWASPEDTQGVMGEYPEYAQESSEISRDIFKENDHKEWLKSSQEQRFKYELPQNGSTDSVKMKLNETHDSTNLDLVLSTENPTTPTSIWEWTSPATTREEAMGNSPANEANAASHTDKPKEDDPLNSTTAPCKTSNHSWGDTDDFTPNESLLSLSLGLSLFLPLYSDWNSALATWGLVWDAHIYGLGSVFSVLGLVSLVCLLGLPWRCPPGVVYFLLLHLFLLTFVGMQAFCLIYDPYSYQDRLPPLALLLLCSLPFPCLISAFSAAFVLLSLRSNMQISLPLAISPSFSALPKPCLLLCMCVLHFALSLGCAGILQLFPSLPSVILLIPQGFFVCLSVFLSCSYFVFFCLIRVDNIYRLDNGESGGSPEVIRHRSCPLAKMEDWERALRAGLGASLCLFCSGGLQLYGVLHVLGLGGFDELGFHPWPWLGFQVGCRLGEIGICLGLVLIGTHPIFCHRNSSIKSIIKPQPRSWSRLSCSSPSRALDLPSDGGVLSSHESWGKQETVMTIKDEIKEKSDTLPLCSMVDTAGNGNECVQNKQISVLPLPSPPSPPGKPKNEEKSNHTSLNKLDSTVDLRPPSPINLSRSIDQALFSESLFSHSLFDWPKLFQTSSSLSLNRQGTPGLNSAEKALYRTSSCGDMDQENNTLQPHDKQPMSPTDWKGSVIGSTQGLCTKPKEAAKGRSHSWANRGHHFTQNSLPRAIQHLSHYRRFRTLSFASQDSQGSGRLAGTKHLSESKQLEWDLAVQAEFVTVCRQIDALSVCSDTIEL